MPSRRVIAPFSSQLPCIAGCERPQHTVSYPLAALSPAGAMSSALSPSMDARTSDLKPSCSWLPRDSREVTEQPRLMLAVCMQG